MMTLVPCRIRLPLYLFTIAVFCCSTNDFVVTGQRFMRQGFSGNEDFGAELKLDEKDASGAVDMTREMFLMQDLSWQLPPPLDNYASITDGALRQHILSHTTRQPVALQLHKKRGKFGLRAVGVTNKGQRLRAFWRPAPPLVRGSVDFLQASYDDACRARLFTIEFELQLPPLKHHRRRAGSAAGALPSVVYQVAVEPGSVNPKALVPRSSARVLVYPAGRKDASDGTKAVCLSAGTAPVSVTPVKAGLVDPSWAKGRPIFRKGRNSGLM